MQEKINKTTERAHICTPVINTSPKRANIHNGDIRIIILFSIGKSTTRILKKKVWQDWGIIKKHDTICTTPPNVAVWSLLLAMERRIT